MSTETTALPTPNFKTTSEPAPAPVGANPDLPDLPPDPSQDESGSTQFDTAAPVQPAGKEPTTFPGDDNDFDPTVVDFESFLTPQTPAKVTPADPSAVAPAPAPAASPTPAVAPAAAPATPQAADPKAAPVAPQPAAPEAAKPAQPTADPLTAIQEGVAKNRDKFVEALSKHYESTFTDEDIEELQTSPKVALSKMAARLHVDALQNQMAVVAKNLPMMVTGIIKAHQVQTNAEDTFFKQFPQLDRAKDYQTVQNIAAAARQINPQMPHEQFVQMVGAMACQYLGRPVAGAPAPAAAPQPQAGRPAAPRGFVPAGGGAIPTQPAAPGKGNPWAEMANAFAADNS